MIDEKCVELQDQINQLIEDNKGITRTLDIMLETEKIILSRIELIELFLAQIAPKDNLEEIIQKLSNSSK